MGTRGVPNLIPRKGLLLSRVILALNCHDRTVRKIAVLIVHAENELFEAIRTATHAYIYQHALEKEIDVFYLVGKQKSSRIRRLLNELIEKNRRSRYFILSRLFDYIVLNPSSWLPRNIERDGSFIRVDTPEDLRHLGFKLITAFEMLEEQGYEWVFRTTTSSVLNLPKLLEIVECLNTEPKPIFAGAVAHREKSHDFIVGSCLLVNRKAIQFILDNKRKWDHSLLDDVALGRLFRGEFEPIPLKQISVSSCDQVKNLENKEFTDAILIRCKTDSKPRTDAEVMRAVSSRLLNS